MFCPNCGAQLEDDAKYCPECGAPLAGEGRAPSGPQVDAPQSAPDAKKPAPVKLIALVCAVVVVLGLIVALAVVPTCTRGQGSTTDSVDKPESAPEPEPEPEPSDDKIDASAFVGSWVAQDSDDEDMPAEWFESAADQGVYIVLTLEDDGDGLFQTDSGPVDVSWEAESEGTATMEVGESTVMLAVKRNKLTLTNANGLNMYFVLASEVDMSNAVDVTEPQNGTGTVDPSSIQVAAGMQLVGNEYVGYLQVPSSWTNRDADLEPVLVSDYAATYWVDSTTEFTSVVRERFDFAQSVELSGLQGSYKEIAAEFESTYQGSDYGDTTASEVSIDGHNGILVVSSLPDDNLNIATLVMDRNDDESLCVVIALNCGPIGSESVGAQIVGYASTWQV